MQTLWVDFQNMGHDGVRLICNGTLKELSEKNIELKEGLEFLIWDHDEDAYGNPDNLIVEAIVKYSTTDNCWVAQFNPDDFRNESGTSNLDYY